MPARPSPAVPTPKAIRDAFKAVRELCPGARIARVGPQGVEFVYPDADSPAQETDPWQGEKFG
ncbi:MAG: hypothetical protein ACQEUZ_06415 [Pseudomonadota bacterium]